MAFSMPRWLKISWKQHGNENLTVYRNSVFTDQNKTIITLSENISHQQAASPGCVQGSGKKFIETIAAVDALPKRQRSVDPDL